MVSRTKKENPLITFEWEGKDRTGNKSKGKIDAESLLIAKSHLKKQGVIPTKVRKQSEFSLFSNKDKPVKAVDIAFFTRQMSTMLNAGVPLLQGLDIVANGTEKHKLKHMIYAIRDYINSGGDFSSALRKHPRHFDDLTCSLVEAGEQSGSLETMLDRIATYKEKVESLKAKIRKALTYPSAVVGVGFAVTALLLVKVVPQFETIFRGFGADLPTYTLMVVRMSEFAQANWFYALIAGIIGTFIFVRVYRVSLKLRDAVDRFLLKIPVIGMILYKAAIARFARTLATTFAAGVPLVSALDSAAGAAGNVVFRHAIIQIRNGISTGQSLTNALNMTGVFPSMPAQMIAIGEESGSLEMMLEKIATFYEEEVDNAVDNLSSLLEPLIMVVLGILVGGLVVAMYLPIFQLGNVF